MRPPQATPLGASLSWQPDYLVDYPDLDDIDPPDDGLPVQASPCPMCGEVGACGWDTEGRPLIHAVPAEDGGVA